MRTPRPITPTRPGRSQPDIQKLGKTKDQDAKRIASTGLRLAAVNTNSLLRSFGWQVPFPGPSLAPTGHLGGYDAQQNLARLTTGAAMTALLVSRRRKRAIVEVPRPVPRDDSPGPHDRTDRRTAMDGRIYKGLWKTMSRTIRGKWRFPPARRPSSWFAGADNDLVLDLVQSPSTAPLRRRCDAQPHERRRRRSQQRYRRE